MTRYRITFEVLLDDQANHPRKWVPEAIADCLRPTEDADNWQFEEITDTQEA
jgi:hypothetical protein